MGKGFNVIIVLIILGGFITGGILLQIFLSKRESKWPGLILPFLTFCISLLMILGIAIYSITSRDTSLRQYDENGTIISETAISEKRPIGNIASTITLTVITFLLYNIPTAILLAIYTACREKNKRNLALEKMSVQDLE